jgi:hypothetical protein
MKTFIVIASVFGAAVLGAGCGPTMVGKSQDTLRAQASQELACGTAEAKVVYYGLRGADIKGDSACFGPTADKLAVVECVPQRRAYWGFGDRWEARPETVTAVEADHVEISTGPTGGAVEAVARCGH